MAWKRTVAYRVSWGWTFFEHLAGGTAARLQRLGRRGRIQGLPTSGVSGGIGGAALPRTTSKRDPKEALYAIPTELGIPGQEADLGPRSKGASQQLVAQGRTQAVDGSRQLWRSGRA
jgi:hypothetical protein